MILDTIPFDTSGGPSKQAYQPFERPRVLSEDVPEQNTFIRVQGEAEALRQQFAIVSGTAEPFLGAYASFVNVIKSTEQGFYFLDIIWQRPERSADSLPGGAGPVAVPKL